jgi:hypothetical protein
LIEEGKLKIKILDDTKFDDLCIKFGDTLEEAQKTAAFCIKNKTYFRSSTSIESFMSEIVHEGTHVLDNLSGFIGDVYQIEKRAFFHERAFQHAVGIEKDFDKIEDMVNFIYIEYKN